MIKNEKIILHIPHSSTKIPPKDGFIINEKILKNEKMILSDSYTNDLFDAENQHRVITELEVTHLLQKFELKELLFQNK